MSIYIAHRRRKISNALEGIAMLRGVTSEGSLWGAISGGYLRGLSPKVHYSSPYL